MKRDADKLPQIEEFATKISAFELFASLADLDNCVFLDSAMDPQKLGRYSIMSADPFLIFQSTGENISIKGSTGIEHFKGNPLDYLEQYLNKYRIAQNVAQLPFLGGAIGYLSYDLGRCIEKIPNKAVDDLLLPESLLGFYDVILIYDHLHSKAFIVSTGFPETDIASRQKRARERLAEFKTWLAAEANPLQNVPKPQKSTEPTSNFTHEGYIQVYHRWRYI